jgi:hypothetical protein
MRLPESEISRAERYVQEARRRIVRQRVVIDKLRDDGYDTQAAQRLLRTMLETLGAYEGDQRMLEDERVRTF